MNLSEPAEYSDLGAGKQAKGGNLPANFEFREG